MPAAASDVPTFWIGRNPATTSRLPYVLREEVPVEACWRAGAAVHLVLRRARQRRSLFVWTRKGERTLAFWRSEALMRRAADLEALVRDGRLRVTGAGTKRRYVARLS
ncbi:MAG TPA: hypothetical protein VMQ78_08605 [Candidatus Limnocylindria bacterium]|nr:hypothetical protein [Candidatus Limnocylindria bacterium]